ncbi:RNA polymerase sigma-70 factor (ECF subfamily) [Leeuwenhoekiella aestuarii]|mgnify:FL=1|uniref:RNA polymerase sigma-70 factor (ECF subfamily) n=4 Tax=Leeuwenhoekiella TaxID=283735 RepID=A0A4Q0NY08_9FLAO|nr:MULTISPECIES: RNA polymerase sigma factor [Leeuwenhoekiella]RXG15640.1 RNA polymerase sigma-70 factor (ECF subfamily) [Leeuwenhoekiella aestuarii]RXG17251.1 RNA polymerase sigma-70 factor (ECF subfamily) [Leeuwenhoekiella aestuarii]RXG17779.1 RNA polymerase sigma-70 factor (ECF subfamily) [Leeuwenhoekiella polynyae]RXG30805.1 RNA polymerase sigma-70 factor (ECF subfamily) [Leeuwenhoekiella marinoflava]SHF15909.1 RNA polymerase sigma-70 factor, ECF subfamily [Leeuwenhoekiella marinoflava DSM
MNQNEFLAKVTPVQDRLYRLAKRLLVSEDEAQDATQEVLIKLWSNRKKIKKLRSVEAFAVTMTKNYCYDKLKAKSSSNLQLVHTNYEDQHYNTVKTSENSDSVNWVLKLMKDLPEQQRLVLHMRDVEQYTNSEIAEELDLNETAVRVTLSRARKTIREQLLKKHNYGLK